MPPSIKIERERIIDAALAVIERDGGEALSARTLAAELRVSTQPIYREFGDMAVLREAVTERGFSVFAREINGEALDQAVAYVRFAITHKNLFNFLFRGKKCRYDGLDDMAHKLVDGTRIIERLESVTHLPRERVFRLHLDVWMALHGLACMSADNDVTLTDEEISAMTMEITRALTVHFKSEDK